MNSDAARQDQRCHFARQAAEAAQAQRSRAQARVIGGRQAPHHLRRLGGRAGQRRRQRALNAGAGRGHQRPVGGSEGQATRGQQEVGKEGQGRLAGC